VSASRLDDVFARARSERRAAFIPFLTAGDPSASGTVAFARALDRAGADVLELGVPFSDPIADGPILQRSAARALAAGTALPDVWRIARRIREETSLALVLFSYLNPLLHRGLPRSAREARSAGFDAVLVTDVPAEEGSDMRSVFSAAGLDTVFLVSPTSPSARMARAARLSSGFLYVISRRGTTGVRGSLPADLPATVDRARRAAGRLPVAVGFGISTPGMARAAALLADGVVVGSALVACAEESGNPGVVEKFARGLARACRRPGRKAQVGSPG
jgi:tryptophan synthase alpha chain